MTTPLDGGKRTGLGEATADGWRLAFESFEALQNLDEMSRAAAIDEIARTDPERHRQVVSLIRAHERVRGGAFLEEPAASGIRPSMALAAGNVLGPYRLDRPLGSGGMGEVWLARRDDGLFEAPVALKLLHAHLLASTQRERFVREGRILGQLSHPNIARLLDAGSFDGQSLYLSIEHVDGERIDQWCDDRRVPLEGRVRLFLHVCEAVAHAHARLIVHRDLKPSNILVSTNGDVKLLDFGIAKLIETEEGSSAPATEITRLGGRALTPEYAAPEQILGTGITTVTDVYSLGVLLYALLAGRRPYGRTGASVTQIEREAVEFDPPAPSEIRGGPDDRDDEIIASLRGLTAAQLRSGLKGDLDTIVRRAIKKAPAERYASATEFADDLRRYLSHRPVLARPDSFVYRARKFVRRNAVACAAAAAVSVSLAAGAAAFAVNARETAAHARALAAQDRDLQEVVTFQQRMLERADVADVGARFLERMRSGIDATLERQGLDRAARDAKLAEFDAFAPMSGVGEAARHALASTILEPARDELQKGGSSPGVESALRTSLGRSFHALGLDADGLKQLDRALALADRPTDLVAVRRLGEIRYERLVMLNELDEEGAFPREASALVADLERQLGPEAPETLRARMMTAIATRSAGDLQRAREQLESLLAVQTRVLGPDHEQTLTTANELLGTVIYLGDRSQLDLARRIFEARRRKLGDESRLTLGSRGMVGLATWNVNGAAESIPLFQGLLDDQRRFLGDEHVDTLLTQGNLAAALQEAGRLEESGALQLLAWRGLRVAFGDESMRTQIAAHNYASYLMDSGRAAEALPMFESLLALRSATLGPEHPRTLNSHNHHGMALAHTGHAGEGIEELRAAIAKQTTVLGPLHADTILGRRMLASALALAGRDDQAVTEFDDILANASAGGHPELVESALSDYLKFLEGSGQKEKAGAVRTRWAAPARAKAS